MIDINNKKFNFYDPVTIVDNDKEALIFSETLYILSEKYIPSRENKMIKRSDDNQETVTKRLKTYDNETLPLLEYYKSQNKVINIDAMKPIDEVRKEIKGVLKD